MSLKPKDFCFLIKRNEAKVQTAGGLYIPDKAQEAKAIGKIVAVPDVYEEYELKVGIEVLFSDYAGIDVEHKGEKYVLVNEDNIISIVER